MKGINKTINIAGIICLVMSAVYGGFFAWSLTMDEINTFNIVSDALCIVLSVITGITYLVFARKTQDDIIKLRNAFFTITIMNIFNGIVVWVISFWVQISVSQFISTKQFAKMYSSISTQNLQNLSPEEREDLQIKNNAKELENKLVELLSKKQKGEISEDEYKKTRQEIIDKFI